MIFLESDPIPAINNIRYKQLWIYILHMRSKANLWSVSEIDKIYSTVPLHYTWKKYHYPHHVWCHPTTVCQTSVMPAMTTPTHNYWKFHHSLCLPRCIDQNPSVLFFLLCTANPRKMSWFTHVHPAIVRRACAVPICKYKDVLVHCMLHFSWKWSIMIWHGDKLTDFLWRYKIHHMDSCTKWVVEQDKDSSFIGLLDFHAGKFSIDFTTASRILHVIHWEADCTAGQKV